MQLHAAGARKPVFARGADHHRVSYLSDPPFSSYLDSSTPEPPTLLMDDADVRGDAPSSSQPAASPSSPISLSPVSLSPPAFSTPLPPSPPSPTWNSAPEPPDAFDDDGFGDFDDAPARSSTAFQAGAGAADDDDDFGDFGDFDEGQQVQQGEAFDDDELETHSAAPVTPPAPSWRPLDLFVALLGSPADLSAAIHELLLPVFPVLDSSSRTPKDDPLGDLPFREVPGPGQVLVNEAGREILDSLTAVPPLARLDWTRSRVRREHLIALGVPVDLDEVAPSRLASLPPLRITTLKPSSASSLSSSVPPRPLSTPPTTNHSSVPRRANTISASAGSSRSPRARTGPGSGSNTPREREIVGPGTNVTVKGDERRDAKYGLGDKPPFDADKAKELVAVDAERLSLLPLPELQTLLSSLQSASGDASVLLSYLVQLKDAQATESLVSNGMIADLVANAQKMAMAGAGGGSGWRKSVQQGSGSGRASPGVGS